MNEQKLNLQSNKLGRIYKVVRRKIAFFWNRSFNKEMNVQEPVSTNNPYIAARREWNHMFGDFIKAKHNWQRIAYLLAASNVLLLVSLIHVSDRSRFIPYVVSEDTSGNTSFSGFLQKSTVVNPLEVNAFVRRYITNMRSVIADPVAQKEALDFVYATSANQSVNMLNAYYKNNSPFTQAKQHTVEVQIDNVIQKSTQTWQVDWTEIQRNLSGNVTNQTHWEALVTVGHQPVTAAAEINVNPLGLFVNYVSWSQQL